MLNILNLKAQLPEGNAVTTKPSEEGQLPFRQVKLRERFQSRQEFALNLARLAFVPRSNFINALGRYVTTDRPKNPHVDYHIFAINVQGRVDTASQFCDASKYDNEKPALPKA
jgi:hypothetical protein